MLPEITIDELIAAMKFKQEPPRKRTIVIAGGNMIQVQFPWITIGTLDTEIYAFHHEHPWTTFEEGLASFHTFHAAFHGDHSLGYICTDHILSYNYENPRSMSVSEAFWMTDFVNIGSEDGPFVCYDTEINDEQKRTMSEWVEGLFLSPRDRLTTPTHWKESMLRIYRGSDLPIERWPQNKE